MELTISLAWLLIIAWLIGRAFQQRNLLRVLAPQALRAPERAAEIAVIVPARDEEANIGGCMGSLLAQDYPDERLTVLVIDDHSADTTRPIAEAVARRAPQLRVLESGPLPSGWLGKSHACWIGALAVRPQTEWLCFVDADVQCEPALLTSALATVHAEGLDLLSLAPRQRLVSFAERLILPCGLYLLSFLQDLKTVQSAQCNDATVTGQFMLVRRTTYETVGGHATIRSAICEDLALARTVKRSGGRVMLMDGQRLLTTRMYTGWNTLWEGLSKNLVDTLGGYWPTVATALAAVTLAWAAVLIPAMAAASCAQGVSGACIALLPASIGSAAVFALHLAGTFYFRIPFWYGLLFPLGYAVGALIALDSMRRRLRGRVRWKGRTYP